MAISIGDALLQIKVDKKDFDKSMAGLGNTIGKHRKKIGIAMTAMGAAIVGGMGLALKASVDFESAMRSVNTMMGLGADEFAEFSAEVQSMAADLGVNAVESADALYQAISAGIPKENVLTFLEIATKAAIGGITSTEIAVDGLTTVINAFKLPLSETQRVADIMFQTVKGGKTTFEELSASMFQVAPIAAASGVEFKEVAAALATMTKQGVPTTIATTQLRQAMVALQKPTDDMRRVIKELGFESGQAMLAELGFAKTIDILRNSTEGNNEALLAMFGSVEAGAAILALTGDNAQTFADDLDAMEDSTGAATEAFEEMELSASRQMASLKSAFSDVAISVGNVLLPILKDIVDRIKPIIENIKNWMEAHPGLTKVIVIATGVLGALMLVLGPLLLILPGLTTAFSLLTAGIAKATIAMVGFKVSAVALVATLSLLAAGIGLLTFGLTKLFEARRKNAAAAELWDRVEAERIKLLKGEANEYRALIEEQVILWETFGNLTERQLASIEASKKWIVAYDKLQLEAKQVVEEVEEVTEAVEDSTEAQFLYAEMVDQYILALNSQHSTIEQAIIDFVNYKGGWDNLTDATKSQITVMKEYIEELKLVLERQIEVHKSWSAWVAEIQPSVVAFDAFGLSVEDVVTFLSRQWNMTTSEVLARLQEMDIGVGDVRFSMDQLGITAIEVAAFMAELTGDYDEFLKVISGTSGVLAALPGKIITFAEIFEALDLGAALGISVEEFTAKAEAWQRFIEQVRTAQGGGPVALTDALFEDFFGSDWRTWRQALGYGGVGEPTPDLFLAEHGGLIQEPTLLTSMRTMRPYAIAAKTGPERLLGVAATKQGMGSVNIIVELDGEVLAQALGQPLVEEIRLRTGSHN